MVKDDNTRVMVTLSKETDKMLNEIADMFSMNKSAAMNMCILVFHNSTVRKEK